jgi:hypothetical protein
MSAVGIGGYEPGNLDEVQRLLEEHRSLLAQIDTGGRSLGIRFGSDSLTWPAAGTSSNTKTVTHGLGRAPIVVGGWGSDSTTAQFFYCYPFTFTSTQFSVRGVAELAPGVQTKTFHVGRDRLMSTKRSAAYLRAQDQAQRATQEATRAAAQARSQAVARAGAANGNPHLQANLAAQPTQSVAGTTSCGTAAR